MTEEQLQWWNEVKSKDFSECGSIACASEDCSVASVDENKSEPDTAPVSAAALSFLLQLLMPLRVSV